MQYDVIIIGAGASGLMAAIMAARQGRSVLVLEQKDKAGKKILATGNGKCNFTNMVQTPECYRSEDNAFAMKVLSGFDVSKTLHFFKDLGILPKNRDGYLYPNSDQASSVVAVLQMECDRLKIQFKFNETVKEIIKPYYTVMTQTEINIEEAPEKKSADKNPADKKLTDKNLADKKITVNYSAVNKLKADQNHNINTRQNKYFAKKLILAAGGCATPKLGSDGSGYELAKSLGHKVIKPLPALVQLKSPDKHLKTISGVRTDAEVTLLSNNKKLAGEQGEILFTDYGISGIPILQVSRYAAKALDRGEAVRLSIDFLPMKSKDELKDMLKARIKQNPGKSFEEMLIGLLNHKLSYIILLEAKLDPYKASRLMSDQELEKLCGNIKEFVMNINDTNSFENAQVCSGGVSTAEINPLTMESRLQNGLYITGELVDVDGTCGGYNLQWAWSSGYAAGTAAGNR